MAKKRKPGGGRKKSKPDYNPSAILQNQMDAAVALYDKEEHPSPYPFNGDQLHCNANGYARIGECIVGAVIHSFGI